MGEITARLAGPQDAEPLAKWALSNELIDMEDIKSSMIEENPTTVVLVVEQDGKVLLYAPIYCTMTLAFLAFNPEDTRRQKMEALAKMKDAISRFSLIHGVKELITYSKEEYGVAKWAVKNGFIPEDRTAFKLKMTEV